MSEFKRQHPAAAIDRLYTVIRRNIITFIILLVLGTQSEDAFFAYILGFTLFWSFVSGILGWWMFRYRVEGDELQIRSGLFVKRNHYLTKDKIQVIDITEGIVQRIFRLVKVEIKTAGSGTETATIRALSRAEAEELKHQLRNDINADETANIDSESDIDSLQEVQTATQRETSPEVLASWKLSRKDLIMAGITSGSFGLIASILGAILGQTNFFLTEENIEYLVDNFTFFSGYLIFISIAFIILFVSWVLSFMGVIFKYYGFKVEKTEKELIITSGLLERKQITVPYNRIQAVRFVEGVFRQPFKHGMLYIESAGYQIESAEKSITLVPYLAKTELDGFFGEFLEQYKLESPQLRPPKRALFKYLRFPNYFYAIIAVVLWYSFDLTWQLLIPVPLFAILGWLQYKDAGIYFMGNDIVVRSRFLARETAFLKRKRVQASDEKINPFQKWRKLATFSVTVASGAEGIKFKIRDLDAEDATRLLHTV